jgi:hypothetical protein
MPADLQRTFVYEISPAIRAGNVKGGLIDVLLLSKVKALVADPESDIDRAIQVRDGMDAALAGELAGIQNLTDAAERGHLRLLAAAPGLARRPDKRSAGGAGADRRAAFGDAGRGDLHLPVREGGP